MIFLFEIDISAIRLKLPRGSFPQEIRPGVGLAGVSVEQGSAGNLGTLPAFTEINWWINLEPDLSKKMPVPKFSVYTGKIGSDCEAFLDHAHNVDKLPVYRSKSLRGQVDTETLTSSFEDEHGPLFSLAFSNLKDAVYQPRTHWVQLRSQENGNWFQALSWSGMAWEHQKSHRAGVLYQHPFFEGIDVKGLGDRCYLQITGQPKQQIDIDFYEPVAL